MSDLAPLSESFHGRHQESIRAAHAESDKTRCQGWLAETGNRPVKPRYEHQGLRYIFAQDLPPQEVRLVVDPDPRRSCDLHPAEVE